MPLLLVVFLLLIFFPNQTLDCSFELLLNLKKSTKPLFVSLHPFHIRNGNSNSNRNRCWFRSYIYSYCSPCVTCTTKPILTQCAALFPIRLPHRRTKNHIVFPHIITELIFPSIVISFVSSHSPSFLNAVQKRLYLFVTSCNRDICHATFTT